MLSSGPSSLASGLAIDAAELSDLLCRLIAIESINPHYPGATTGEDRIGLFVRDWFASRGIACEMAEVLPGRYNVLARLPGAQGNAKDNAHSISNPGGLCLEAHLDTVGVDGYLGQPFTPVVRDGRVYGRGSCDTKAGLAAMMVALAAVVASGRRPAQDVLLASVVDEEYAFRGVTHLLTSYRPDAAIVAEPTGLEVVTACKGTLRWRVHAHGLAGHSSRPHEGRNAVYDMAALIAECEHTMLPQLGMRVHPLLGPPTASIGVISGGSIVNVIPDSCVIEIDRRLNPGESWAGVLAEWEKLLAAVTRARPGARFTMEEPGVRDMPMETDCTHHLVQTGLRIRDVHVASCGAVPAPEASEPRGVSYSCDASKFYAAGCPSLIFGPGDILQAHTVEEFVDLDATCRAASWYCAMVLEYAPTGG